MINNLKMNGLKVYGAIDTLASIRDKSDIPFFKLVYRDVEGKFYEEVCKSLSIDGLIREIDSELYDRKSKGILNQKKDFSYINTKMQEWYEDEPFEEFHTELFPLKEVIPANDDFYLKNSMVYDKITPLDEFENCKMEMIMDEFLEKNQQLRGINPTFQGMLLNKCLYVGSNSYLTNQYEKFVSNCNTMMNNNYRDEMKVYHSLNQYDKVIDLSNQHKVARRKTDPEESLLVLDAQMNKQFENLEYYGKVK